LSTPFYQNTNPKEKLLRQYSRFRHICAEAGTSIGGLIGLKTHRADLA
jgi:hypothetical protein